MLLTNSNLPAVLEAYPQLCKSKLLQPRDTAEIAQLIHYAYRSSAILSISREYIAENLKQFINDLKLARIPPHPMASLHLIGYYKESTQYDAGVDFWKWLLKQDDNYIDLRVYGAAIELLASYGVGIEYCKEVYIHGLKRFPQDFNEYHMTPGAILPELDQPVNVRQSSMVLLQGMTKAYLIYGDWRNAYLSLDTVMRLHPTQVPAHFLRMFNSERPILEAFQMFCMFCRSSNQPNPQDITLFLLVLSSAQGTGSGKALDLNISLALLNVVHHVLATGATLTGRHLNILLIGSLRLLPIPSDPGLEGNCNEDYAIVGELLSQVLAIFRALGVVPDIQSYNTIFTMAAKLKQGVLFTEAFNRLSDSGLVPDEITVRCMLTAAGKLKDTALLETIWHDYAMNSNFLLTAETWFAFVKAAKDAQHIQFFYEQLKSNNIDYHSPGEETTRPLKDSLGRRIDGLLKKALPFQEKKREVVGVAKEDLSEQREEECIAENFEEVLDDALESQHTMCMRSVGVLLEALRFVHGSIVKQSVTNLRLNPPSNESVWTFQDNVEESWQLELFHELNVDPTVAAAKAMHSHDKQAATIKPRSAAAKSSTGFRLDELRYKNWKTINDLLLQAEMFETRLDKSVDVAIEHKTPVKQVRSAYNLGNGPERQRIVLEQLQAHSVDKDKFKSKRVTREEWRAKILALRRAET